MIRHKCVWLSIAWMSVVCWGSSRPSRSLQPYAGECAGAVERPNGVAAGERDHGGRNQSGV